MQKERKKPSRPSTQPNRITQYTTQDKVSTLAEVTQKNENKRESKGTLEGNRDHRINTYIGDLNEANNLGEGRPDDNRHHSNNLDDVNVCSNPTDLDKTTTCEIY